MAVEVGELQVSFKVDIVGSLAESIRQALTPEGVRELASALTRFGDEASDAAVTTGELAAILAEPAGDE